ncbi:unnamed protein product [Phytomonas sp. EM1]|nr:unnamed protein product [Phytomonas sp. EM1]|eukprot:CCW65724.1 unnamed protein product [Phytomonas sp. isolate EM1]
MYRKTIKRLVAAGSGPFDPYKILGISPSASKDEIKRAYHRLALRYHPDGGPEGNAERFAAVHEAYEAVKSGQWKPIAEQMRTTTQGEAYGWDPGMRMYVYEKPGSTTENYVSGHTQTILRLCMVWCFLFFVVRISLFYVFPNHTNNNGDQILNDLHADRTCASRVSVSGDSIHDDEAEFKWAVGMHGDTGPQPANFVDSLPRRT